MPDDRVCGRHFVFLEEHVESMDAVIILDDIAGARNSRSDADLSDRWITLNLLSLSSLKVNEVGPVSCTRYSLYSLATGSIWVIRGVGLFLQATALDIVQ